MRLITEKAVEHFLNAKSFNQSNTQIKVLPNVTIMLLFGNKIAYKYNDPEQTMSITNAGYKTNVTKERLNGLSNVHIVQKNGTWFLNGQEWDGNLIDVK
ncbi:MAG: hypothetical protein U9Q27_01475 [Patescibacteria group bacterium]|nr:hypothetical protein [Patescibacteria group bacterium]